MPLVPSAPLDLRDSRIYRQLTIKNGPGDGLVERVESLVETASPLLDLVIAGPFRTYTLHNPGHSRKIVHLSGHLLSQSTLSALTAFECTIMIAAAYLHDLGMCLTSVERNRILQSAEFDESIREWPELWSKLGAVRAAMKVTVDSKVLSVLEADAYQLQEVALAAFLRPRHASPPTYDNLIEMLKEQSGRNDLFEYRGVPFEDVLKDICVSHNLDVASLAQVSGPYEERFPRSAVFAGQRVNVQFLAATLRLADILDFDRERTPRVLFDSLGISGSQTPGAKVSLEEWQKHLAVHTIDITPDELVISCDSRHPAIEAAIRRFCSVIERELRDTLAVLKRNETEVVENYSMDMPVTVRPRIRSLGYVFRDVSLRLNQSAVMTLLMGDQLYSTPHAALRELVQNSMDACLVRRELTPDFQPEIRIDVERDQGGRVWLRIADNGIGMDEHVLTEYFLQVGSSYYKSAEFQRLRKPGKAPFVPISRLGIGIVSTFMIGDFA